MGRRISSLIIIFMLCLSASVSGKASAEVFDLLNLDYPGLERVRDYVEKGKYQKASEALLEYYRTRQEVILPNLELKNIKASGHDRLFADDGLKHTFHVLADPVWNYGKDIDWQYWPQKDIEIRVQLHRFPWWTPMGKMFRISGDEKYASEWVYQFRDWVKKNPYKPFEINQHGTVSSGTIDIDSPNECFAWRPLEIGIRLGRLCAHFALFLPSKNFTPEFLTEFLRCYHENASILMKTFSPAGNHVIHQSQGIIHAGVFFPEFKDAEVWLKAGADNLNREITRQTYPDGCHIEFDPGYHIGFVASYNSAIQVAFQNGRMDLFPKSCLEQLGRVTRYYIDNTYPDGGAACFSDERYHTGKRYLKLILDMAAFNPSDKQLLWFGTEEKEGVAPSYKSAGHPDTGFYTFRDGWSAGKIVMPIKATERGMWHAQPDFGTFELWAYGKILMPDAGSYTYSGDEEIERQRAYFKATARHNGITLDDRNYEDPAPKVISWQPEGSRQLLSVQHEAYKGLTRRRGIAFVDEKFFVILDEVSGPATGTLKLRNCFGDGNLKEASSPSGSSYIYQDGNSGLKVLMADPEGSTLKVTKDWFSPTYLVKRERPVLISEYERKADSGIQRFVTVLCPFEGDKATEVSVESVKTDNGQLSVNLVIDGTMKSVSFPALQN